MSLNKRLVSGDPPVVDPLFTMIKYTSNSTGTRSITGAGFSPGLSIHLTVTRTEYRHIYDIRRQGSGVVSGNSGLERLNFATNDASSDGGVCKPTYTSDGFDIASGNSCYNNASETNMAYLWDMGSSQTTRTNGSETSYTYTMSNGAVSLGSYDGPGSAGTVAHGLGGTPEMYWVKARNGGAGQNWVVYHKDIPSSPDNGLILDGNQASSSLNYGAGWFNETNPTSTVFSIGTGSESGSVSTSGRYYNFYAFRSISGFSKVGSWTGNGSTDTTISGVGFQPKFLLLKDTGSTEQWQIYDGARGQAFWHPNLFNAQGTNSEAVKSFNSDGFVIGNDGSVNTNGNTYIYLAFGGDAVRVDDQT
jgi:hypothetical protein